MVRHLFGLENFGSTGLQQPLSVESLQQTEKKKKKKKIQGVTKLRRKIIREAI